MAALLTFVLFMGLIPTLTEGKAEAFTPTHSIIRIGINGPSSWRATPSVRLDNAGGLRIGSFNAQRQFVPSRSVTSTFTRLTVSGSGSSVVVRDGDGNIIRTEGTTAIAPVNGNITTTYTLPNTSFGVENRTHFYFHGGFRFTAASGNLTVVNYVDIDDHVKGVVPYEAIPSWPIDALKAQALAARTFAVANFGRHGSHNFDLCNSTHCHVYRGQHRANANTNRSVTETRGAVILHNGRPIEAFYHSASGGATERPENVWMSSRPYLLGVRNTHEVAPSDIRWSRTFTPSELRTHMRNRDPNFNLPDIVDVIPTYTEMGNMLSVRFVASNGAERVYSREQARTRIIGGFRFNSQRFTITRNAPLSALEVYDDFDTELELEPEVETDETLALATLAQQGAPSTQHVHVDDPDFFDDLFFEDYYSLYSEIELMAMARQGLLECDLPPQSEIALLSTGVTFTIRNYGFGHNVGMSQHGAASMARLGYNYRQIIQFYYQNITITGTSSGNGGGGTPPLPPGTFTDVPSSAWFYEAVHYVRRAGLMQGTSSTTFAPNATTTRGMFVTLLGRMAGVDHREWYFQGTVTGSHVNLRTGPGTQHSSLGTLPRNTSVRIIGRVDNWYHVQHGSRTGYMSRDFVSAAQGTFSDVRAGAFYAPYVEWARSRGIVSGTGGGTFSPNRPITRQEMASQLHRYTTAMNITLERDTEMPPFADIDQVASWARGSVIALQQAGLIHGMGDNRFAPTENSNRAAVATLIMNFHSQHG